MATSWCVSVNTLLLTPHSGRLHYSHKGIPARALERDEERCAIFMNHIAETALDMEMLMFGDEAAKDKRTPIRRFGVRKLEQGFLRLYPSTSRSVPFFLSHQ